MIRPLVVCFLLFVTYFPLHAKIISDRKRWWPEGRVHYRIHYGVDVQMVRDAMREIEDRTCIRFVENDGGQHHIDIVAADGCFSDIGYKHSTPPSPTSFADIQLLSLGPLCASKGVALHEIGHALGFTHEHNRMDRDYYVHVEPKNVRPGRIQEYYRKRDLEYLDVPYDLGSIMHYSARTFAREGVNAMLPLDENYHQTMGQRGDMSFYDMKLLNEVYCSDRCSSSTRLNCQNSGYADPNDCAKCLCPVGFQGRLCEMVDSDENCPISSVTAKNSWETLTFTADRNCSWMIRTEYPKHHVEFRVKSIKIANPPHGICDDNYVQIKYKADFELLRTPEKSGIRSNQEVQSNVCQPEIIMEKVFKTPERLKTTAEVVLSPASRAIMNKFSVVKAAESSPISSKGQILKTPERCRPSTSKANVILSPASRAIMEKFSSHSAARNQEHKGVAVYKKTLPERDEGVVRKRADRALLHGFDCRCCATYYDALKLSPESRKRRIDEVSRHRGVQELPPTPPRYWDLQMPSTQTQQHLGWIETSDSPLAKKPRGKTARKLFVQ
ncbi:hypothetical protein QR680_015054 [Steinernema hermaphroditum]|uniref:Metalloendopeptidase n=1 Tax=Steinernema hermaphroditum TaxID=289476 RepID=A0AA39IAZ2_9BILA|nr:hypothetical protein QR680_015054 [Steinernema hermaphroditum]